MSPARTSPAARPKVSTGAALRAAMAATNGSSALRTAVPSAGSASISSPLATATPARSPKSSRCAPATTVTTPTRGWASSHSAAMWPGPLAPISTTSASTSSGALHRVSGTPISLLKDRSLAEVTSLVASTPAIRSFTVVFPTDPVTPMTLPDMRARAKPARSFSAAPVWATSSRRAARPSPRLSALRSDSAAVAPAASAAPMKS